MRFGLFGIVAVAVGTGCYSPPKPKCGFICGPAAACPEDYSCNGTDGRCHRNDALATICPSFTDAGFIQFDGAPPEGGDVQPPSVISFSPGSGATGISVAPSVIVTFSEDVLNVSAGTLFVVQSGTTVPGTVSYNAVLHSATWRPDAQLSATTMYTVNVVPTIVDHAGNPLTTGEVWSFMTGADQVAPSVLSHAPTSGSVGVTVAPQLTALFDETITNVTTTTFTLDQSGTPIAGTVNLIGKSARFTPVEQLAANTLLTARLTSGIQDVAGNAFAGTSWSFTTGADLVPPALTSTTPAAGAANVSVAATITIVFNEPVQNVNSTSFTVNQSGTPIGGTITTTNGGRSATFTPTLTLPPATAITVTLTTAITDAAANALAPISYMFMTI